MTTLGHVNIDTARLSDTIDFYCGLMGFTSGEAATRPGTPEFVWLFDDAGNPWIHLHEVSGGAAADAASAVNHIAFNHDDPEAAEAFLQRNGLEYRRVDTIVPDVFQLNVSDPNGVRVELTFGHENLVRTSVAA